VKVLAAAVVLLVVAVAAVFSLFVLVVALNGFSDRDGGVAVVAFLVVGGVSVLGAAVATPFLVSRNERRGATSPNVLAMLLGSALGVGALIIGFVASIALAVLLRAAGR
jgi:hypothetical protein